MEGNLSPLRRERERRKRWRKEATDPCSSASIEGPYSPLVAIDIKESLPIR
jgi:hypothetical protein